MNEQSHIHNPCRGVQCTIQKEQFKMHSDYLGRKMERLILEQEVQSMDHYFKLIPPTIITCTYIHSPTTCTPANQKLTSLILHENITYMYMYKDIYRMSTIIITYVYIIHTCTCTQYIYQLDKGYQFPTSFPQLEV